MMNDVNTILIGLLRDGRSAGLVKLRKLNGDLEEVSELVGDDPWQVLAELLQDIKPIKAKQCLIFSNAKLEMKRIPKKPVDTRWVRKGKMWMLTFNQTVMDAWQREHASKFVVLHQLFLYDRWRYVEVDAGQLSTTRRLLNEYHQ